MLTKTGANSYVLNFGTVTEGAAASTTLKVANGAAAPADGLDGSFTVNGSGFSSSGFSSFTALAAGASVSAGTITLNTASTGSFTETITLTPVDDSGSGFTQAETPLTVTVEGNVAPAASAQGDVHMVTFDGLHYDFQAIGDFTLARSTGTANPFDVQIATAAYPLDHLASVTTAVAVRLGSDSLIFALDGSVRLNGVADGALSAAGAEQTFGGGAVAHLASGAYCVDWSGGERLTIANAGIYLNVAMTLGAGDGPGSVCGLLGADEGPARDFRLPDGSVLAQPLSAATLLGTFADAWSAAPHQSMLMAFIAADHPGETLAGGPGAAYSGTVAGLAGDLLANFSTGDLVDITNLPVAGASLAVGADGGLTIAGAGAALDFAVSNLAAGASFALAADGQGGSILRVV